MELTTAQELELSYIITIACNRKTAGDQDYKYDSYADIEYFEREIYISNLKDRELIK